MKLSRCLYFSAARPDLPFWQTAAEIVGASQAGNDRMELTGALLAHDGWFVQCLEGLPARLTRLLVTIGADRRHSGMEIIEFGPAERRLFEGWSMAHVELTPLMKLKLGQTFDPTAWTARDLTALMLDAGRAA